MKYERIHEQTNIDCKQMNENERDKYFEGKLKVKYSKKTGQREREKKWEESSPLLTLPSLSLLSNNIKAFYELLVEYLGPVSIRNPWYMSTLHHTAHSIQGKKMFRISHQLNSININRLTCTFHQTPKSFAFSYGAQT